MFYNFNHENVIFFFNHLLLNSICNTTNYSDEKEKHLWTHLSSSCTSLCNTFPFLTAVMIKSLEIKRIVHFNSHHYRYRSYCWATSGWSVSNSVSCQLSSHFSQISLHKKISNITQTLNTMKRKTELDRKLNSSTAVYTHARGKLQQIDIYKIKNKKWFMPEGLRSSEALCVPSKQMIQAVNFKHQPSSSYLYQEEAKDFCGRKKS